MPVIIGPAGWQYRDRRDAFYPRGVTQKGWLAFYAGRFAAVEINSSFYQLPKEGTFIGWREHTPDDFVFAVKASRFITHIKRLKDVDEAVKRFMEHARPEAHARAEHGRSGGGRLARAAVNAPPSSSPRHRVPRRASPRARSCP